MRKIIAFALVVVTVVGLFSALGSTHSKAADFPPPPPSSISVSTSTSI